MENERRSGAFLWEMVKFAITGIAAVFAFLAKQGAAKATQEAEKVTVAMSVRGQQSQFDVKAYELVEKTLTLGRAAAAGHGVAAAAIVNALTAPPLRDDLLNALRAGLPDSPLLKQLDDAREFDAEEFEIRSSVRDTTSTALNPSSHPFAWLTAGLVSVAWAQTAGSSLAGYSIDIMYCQGASVVQTEARKARAAVAYDKLSKSKLGASLRQRLLPTLVQARPAYKSLSDEVRSNSSSTEQAASQRISRIVGIQKTTLHQGGEPRPPKYIAVLYCARA